MSSSRRIRRPSSNRIPLFFHKFQYIILHEYIDKWI
jgi:hypothetical protein